MNQYRCRVCKGNDCVVITSQGLPNCGCLHNSDIGALWEQDSSYQSERDTVLDELKKRQKESYVKANTPEYSLEFVNVEAHGMAIAFMECIELLGGIPVPLEDLCEELRQAGEP